MASPLIPRQQLLNRSSATAAQSSLMEPHSITSKSSLPSNLPTYITSSSPVVIQREPVRYFSKPDVQPSKTVAEPVKLQTKTIQSGASAVLDLWNRAKEASEVRPTTAVPSNYILPPSKTTQQRTEPSSSNISRNSDLQTTAASSYASLCSTDLRRKRERSPDIFPISNSRSHEVKQSVLSSELMLPPPKKSEWRAISSDVKSSQPDIQSRANPSLPPPKPNLQNASAMDGTISSHVASQLFDLYEESISKRTSTCDDDGVDIYSTSLEQFLRVGGEVPKVSSIGLTEKGSHRTGENAASTIRLTSAELDMIKESAKSLFGLDHLQTTSMTCATSLSNAASSATASGASAIRLLPSPAGSILKLPVSPRELAYTRLMETPYPSDFAFRPPSSASYPRPTGSHMMLNPLEDDPRRHDYARDRMMYEQGLYDHTLRSSMRDYPCTQRYDVNDGNDRDIDRRGRSEYELAVGWRSGTAAAQIFEVDRIRDSSYEYQKYRSDNDCRVDPDDRRPSQSERPAKRTWPRAEHDKAPITEDLLPYVGLETCDICNMQFNHPKHAKSHFVGKNHHKKLKVLGLPVPDYCIAKIEPQAGKKAASNQPAEGAEINIAESAAPASAAATSGSTAEGDEEEPWPDWMQKLCQDDFCKICNVPLSSLVVADAHYLGKKHYKKCQFVYSQGEERQVKDTAFGSTPGLCLVCSVRCSSQESLNAHLEGAAHKKAAHFLRAKTDSITVFETQREAPELLAKIVDEDVSDFVAAAAKMNGLR